jgi:NAD(P)H-hydrate repair Nnr-like enzyme with NAD(P)H-hydrate dehydratase domain
MVPLTVALPRRWPLPALDAGGDKESRGRVLVAGGSIRLPGAVVLAGTAALRVGPGLVGDRAVAGLLVGLLRRVRAATVVVDAAALPPVGANRAGLAARAAEPTQAAAWGVYADLHGEAGNVLARRMGGIGFLARELLDEVPPIMASLAKRR